MTSSYPTPPRRARNFYQQRSRELTVTVLKLDAQVRLLESQKDVALVRCTQAERDLAQLATTRTREMTALVESRTFLRFFLGAAAGSFLTAVVCMVLR